jgi:plastocyanin
VPELAPPRVIRTAAPHAEAGMRRVLLTAVLGAALLSGCGDGGGDAATTGAIAIRGFAYSPASATVKVGRTVSVRNRDDAPHTLTDRGADRAFDSGTIRGGRTGAVTFERPGTYAYFCELHPFMKGTVTVVR